jgi:L,D-transpeptidase YcbB
MKFKVVSFCGSLLRASSAAALIAVFAGHSDVFAATTTVSGAGPATTQTEVLANKSVAPMLTADSARQMQAAEEFYAQIVSKGGWSKLAKAGLKKGAEGNGVAALNQRLFAEGYLRAQGVQGEFLTVFTDATQDALARYQKNHGLAVTGRLDAATLASLNVPAKMRLMTIRANIARLKIYGENLGGRYLIVNIPSAQIETVSNGRVFSRHNAIVGRPERPTPVVMTALTQVKFNPYWNAPASIVERDIVPKLRSGTQILEDMNIKVFQGVGGPEIDPGEVDWDNVVVDDYHFRQEPGPENAMATAKIDFTSPFGIYLHDTPEKMLFKSGKRFFSSGCVRVEKMPVLVNWVLNGQDGYNRDKIDVMAETLEQTDLKLTAAPQLRVVYLTAWPIGNTVAFRDDVYGLDQTGFTVGQPMPVGETSPEGLRYVLKPIPRTQAQVDADEGFGFFKNVSARGAKRKTGVGLTEIYGDPVDGSAQSVTVAPKRQTGVSTSQTSGKVITKINTDPKAMARKKRNEEAKAAAAAKVKKRKGIFNDLFEETTEEPPPAKPAKVKAAAAKTKKVVGSETAASKKPVKAAAKPAASAGQAKTAAAKQAVPASAKCKPGADGKIPAGCVAAKPAAKTDPAVAAN